MSSAYPLVQIDGVTMGARKLPHRIVYAVWREVLGLEADQVLEVPRKERIELKRAWRHFCDLVFDPPPLTYSRERRPTPARAQHPAAFGGRRK